MPAWLVPLLESIKPLLDIVKKLLSLFIKTPIEKQDEADDKIIKDRQKTEDDKRPPPNQFPNILIAFVGLFVGALVTASISCISASTIVERKIFFPDSIHCLQWESTVNEKEPMLYAVDPKNDLKLSQGHKQSCFTQDDLIKIQKRIAELEAQLKACQGGQPQ